MRLLICLLLSCLLCSASANGYSSIISSFLNEAKEKDIISPEQYNKLLELLKDESIERATTMFHEADPSSDSTPNIFARMYNKLTLLNVLYFSGSLLIMGAYSLLMTLAFEHFTRMSLANVIAAQTTAFGVIGILIWDTDYQFLGGLLVSISTGMVPYTVYCYQRALDLWKDKDPGSFMDFRIYVRSGWIHMEIAAIAVGFIYLYLVPFPFLLAPVSFSLWFLSMDVAPLFRGFNSSNAFDIRLKLSLGFGIGLMILGRLLEWVLGSDPDFGFWLYLFGLIAFWFALISHPPTNDVMKQTVFLLINICLVLIGSHLDRVTFHLFGTVGVALAVQSYFRQSRIETSVVLWMIKALAAVSLLSNGIRTGGSIEILNAIVCFIVFNVEGLVYINKGELYNLLILLTNLGFVSVLPSFDRPLNLWFLQLPSTSAVLSVLSLSVLLYHVKVLQYYQNRFNLSGKDVGFLTYRLFVNTAVSLVFLFLRQPWWAWVGCVGVPMTAMLTQPNGGNRNGATKSTMISQFLLLLFSISVAVFIDSNLFYLVSCLCMGASIMVFLGRIDHHSVIACGLAVSLILFAIPLQSKFMISIGGLFIFSYLSNLAYTAFKNSVVFPLALVGLGICLIFIGVVYQAYQDFLYEISLRLIPVDQLSSFNKYIHAIDWYSLYVKEVRFVDVLSNPFIWLMWPGPMIQALSREPVPFASLFCGIAIGIIMLSMSYMKTIQDYCPNLTSKVQVSSFALSLDRNAGSGIIVNIRGTKPEELGKPHYVSLNLTGDVFWRSMGQQFGAIPVKLLRSALLPYQLTPSLITLSGFKKGSSEFTAEIELGTGKGGKPGFSHQTIISNCRKVMENKSSLRCVLLYSNAVYLPYAPLCEHSTTVNSICNMLTKE